MSRTVHDMSFQQIKYDVKLWASVHIGATSKASSTSFYHEKWLFSNINATGNPLNINLQGCSGLGWSGSLTVTGPWL